MPTRVAKQKTTTTRLPQSLLEQIDETAHHPQRTRHGKPRVSRKETRKQDRVVRKQHKADFFLSGVTRNKRLVEDDHIDSPKLKRVKYSNVNSTINDQLITHPSSQPNPAQTPIQPSALSAKLPAQETRPGRKAKTSRPRITIPRSQKEEEEDLYIKYLETKLKHGRREFEDDGLDDLLDLADSFGYPQPQDDNKTDKGQTSEYSTMMSGEGSFDEWYGISEEDESTEIVEMPPESAANAHLRNKPHEIDRNLEEIARLTRQLKGLLNRMSEENMITILEGVEDIYRNYKRNDVSSTLTTLIIDGIASHSSLLDSYVVLHAAFIASLHKIVGLEFAAHFVQHVVSSYERYYGSTQSTQLACNPDGQLETDTLGKECSNLIVLLSELYNFQVISSILVFDIIRGLLEGDLAEFRVELLLKIVRNSGQQLRQDDPSALTDIIQIVQSRVTDKKEEFSSRTRFMIETLTNIKNKKLRRNATHNQGGDAVERMKKFISGLAKKRHVMAYEPLRVSLDDLHSAETKGKWWLVGAAWGGDPLLDHNVNAANARLNDDASGNTYDNDLLSLAQKQGMNTDIRRTIFVVLMSSDDYIDACERLSRLNLAEIQQREIIRVLLHCCGNERSYNPYYTLVCQHLCHTSHSYKITLQFCLWDFLRDMGETLVGGLEVIKNMKDETVAFEVGRISPTRLRNVAKAYAWWIAKDSLTLGILKPIDFTSLKPQTLMFLREMMVQIFVDSQVMTPALGSSLNVPTTRNRSAIEQIFIKATRNQTLAMGLVFFLSEIFRDVSGDGEDVANLIKWTSGLAKDTLRTRVEVIPAL